jgi:hypothetical protein
MRGRKETAWRKSRRFGDVFGGRTRPKRTDGIFRRLHSFAAPADGTPTPILVEDNPSRDFFFPLGGREVLDALRRLPSEHVEGITHVWLRRVKKGDFASGEHPLAEFVCGRGVRLIVLYPWPKDMLLPLGPHKPLARVLNGYSRWTTDLLQAPGGWFLRWTLPALQSFWVEGVLFHEVGHHVDRYGRRWSKANRRQLEEFADQYAAEWTAKDKRQYP